MVSSTGAKEPAQQRPAENPVLRRRTRQRDAVLDLLAERSHFHTAREIHTALRNRGEAVGLTTVYRIMQLLAEEGKVDVLRSTSGDSLFRLCSQEHHHHLMCRLCGRVVEVSGPAVERWADRVAAEHGFTEVGHALEIFGTCSHCTAETQPGRK